MNDYWPFHNLYYSPVGNHHDHVLTILGASRDLNHLVALVLVGLLDVHLVKIVVVKIRSL